MVTIERHATYTNILLASGPELGSSDYRAAMKSAIYALPAGSPVGSVIRPGSYDFWVSAFVGPDGGEAGESYGDSSSPKPLQAIVFIGNPGDTTAQLVDTAMQEVGHRWLAYSDTFTMLWNSQRVSLMSQETIAQEANAGTPFTGPLLMGRADQHWSPYFQAAPSAMDGNGYNIMTEDSLSRWDFTAIPVPDIEITGLPPLAHGALYNDLDRVLMGVLPAANGYPSSEGQFQWIEPRVTSGINCHIGIFLMFSPSDIAFFGFYMDPRTVSLDRSNGATRVDAAVGLGYQPFSQPYGAMMFRVVRRGQNYYFQCRNGNSTIAALQAIGAVFGGAVPPSNLPQMFDQLSGDLAGAHSFNGTDFSTVASFTEAAQPLAVGVVTKTWDPNHPVLAEGSFFSLELMDGTSIVTLPSTREAVAHSGPYVGLQDRRLYVEQPQSGTWIRHPDAVQTLVGVPWSQSYDQWNGANYAPKFFTKAPTGDFAFGSSLKVVRSMFSPATGGSALGTSMWGVQRSASVHDVQTTAAARSHWPIFPATYRMAFIAAAQDRSAITDDMVHNMDLVRQYFEQAFREGTLDQIRVDSRL